VLANIRAIDQSMPIFEVSARTGEGFAPWLEWLKEKVKSKS
jgi:hydrogenase nickel incorporation protein HypB